MKVIKQSKMDALDIWNGLGAGRDSNLQTPGPKQTDA